MLAKIRNDPVERRIALLTRMPAHEVWNIYWQEPWAPRIQDEIGGHWAKWTLENCIRLVESVVEAGMEEEPEKIDCVALSRRWASADANLGRTAAESRKRAITSWTKGQEPIEEWTARIETLANEAWKGKVAGSRA